MSAKCCAAWPTAGSGLSRRLRPACARGGSCAPCRALRSRALGLGSCFRPAAFLPLASRSSWCPPTSLSRGAPTPLLTPAEPGSSPWAGAERALGCPRELAQGRQLHQPREDPSSLLRPQTPKGRNQAPAGEAVLQPDGCALLPADCAVGVGCLSGPGPGGHPGKGSGAVVESQAWGRRWAPVHCAPQDLARAHPSGPC